MENLSIFDFLGADHDSLYTKLCQLQLNDKTKMKQYEIRRTDKFYEIESDEEHVGFHTLEECYRYLKRTIGQK